MELAPFVFMFVSVTAVNLVRLCGDRPSIVRISGCVNRRTYFIFMLHASCFMLHASCFMDDFGLLLTVCIMLAMHSTLVEYDA